MLVLKRLFCNWEESDMVEWKTIDELGSYFGGLTGKTKKDFENGNARFITYMNVFSNPNLDVSSVGSVQINDGEKQNKIQKGDILFTGSSETPDESGMSCVVTDDLHEDYYMNSFCFGLRLHDYEQYNLHYFKHIFRSYKIRQAISKTASGVTRFNISKARFSKIQIPIPSKSEQERIVSILDTFTSSISNLKEQIKERRKQYEYYRDQLLDLEGKDGVEMKTLIEIAELGTGSSNTNEELPSGKYPFFVRSQEVRWKDEYEFDETAIITSGDGVGVGKIFHYIEGKYALHQRAYRIHLTSNEVISKFLYYYFTCHFYSYIHKNAFNSSVTSVRKPMLQKFPIPIIPIERQMKIIYQLETFEASIANLEAQLKEREKQYEYYRNQLLTFE